MLFSKTEYSGRLKDLLGLTAGNGGSESLDLSNVTFVVLDEADRMLDEGFRPAVEAILKQGYYFCFLSVLKFFVQTWLFTTTHVNLLPEIGSFFDEFTLHPSPPVRGQGAAHWLKVT